MAASASAAGGEPQKQFLSIIRDFAAEKSHGERTVSGLKRRLDDVVAASDAATAELEAAKRAREAAETELRGSEVQASMAAASIQALEATVSHLQEEIAKLSSELDALKVRNLENRSKFSSVSVRVLVCWLNVTRLCVDDVVCVIGFGIGTGGVALLVLDVMAPKSKEDIERDEFLRRMAEMNAKIRQFQQKASVILAERCSGPPSADVKQGKSAEGKQDQNESGMNETMDSEAMLTDSVDEMNSIDAEVQVLEEEYQRELLELEKLRQELADVRAKRALMESVMKESKQLQELGGRVAELENAHNSLAEELQRQYTCAGCGANNMAAEEEAAPAAVETN